MAITQVYKRLNISQQHFFAINRLWKHTLYQYVCFLALLLLLLLLSLQLLLFLHFISNWPSQGKYDSPSKECMWVPFHNVQHTTDTERERERERERESAIYSLRPMQWRNPPTIHKRALKWHTTMDKEQTLSSVWRTLSGEQHTLIALLPSPCNLILE